MATLKDMLDEQARIRSELQRMEADEDITEEKDGDYRDTLVARWEELDEATKPLISRMEKVRGITRAAANPDNREAGDGTVQRSAPEFLQRRDPFEDLNRVKNNLVPQRDLVSRALNAVDQHAKQGLIDGDRGSEAVRKAQGSPAIAKHMLLTGSDDYVESFRMYLNDPTGEGLQRTALSLTLANGGFVKVAAA